MLPRAVTPVTDDEDSEEEEEIPPEDIPLIRLLRENGWVPPGYSPHHELTDRELYDAWLRHQIMVDDG